VVVVLLVVMVLMVMVVMMVVVEVVEVVKVEVEIMVVGVEQELHPCQNLCAYIRRVQLTWYVWRL
jgi:hypothetical protein